LNAVSRRPHSRSLAPLLTVLPRGIRVWGPAQECAHAAPEPSQDRAPPPARGRASSIDHRHDRRRAALPRTCSAAASDRECDRQRQEGADPRSHRSLPWPFHSCSRSERQGGGAERVPNHHQVSVVKICSQRSGTRSGRPHAAAENRLQRCASWFRTILQIARAESYRDMSVLPANSTKRTYRDGPLIVRFRAKADKQARVASTASVVNDPNRSCAK
jgi:hypothetical protein